LTAALYARVSTDEQSYAMQFTELRDYAGRMGWQIVEYSEKESSVKKRPVLNAMMADARLKKFDVVLVWKLDRFARSLKQLLENIAQLDSFSVRFICVTQGIDTDKQNPASRLMLQMMGAFAEFERALIVERVRCGMAEARRQGKHLGRPVPIWRRDHAEELRAKGLSFRAIASQIGVPEASIRRALKQCAKKV
jgi:putative DNA-invertase from lambdoid prophage Rac